MTRKMIVYLATGLFLAGFFGIAQAGGYYSAREDCCTEGPPYNRNHQQGPIIHTLIVDKGPLYIEGMGFAPRPKGPKTIVPRISYKRDWCCEDMTDEEVEMHFNNANRMEPAAGRN